MIAAGVALLALYASLAFAQAPTTANPSPSAPATKPKDAPAEKQPGIADNSFLLEEAYNQEYSVVQHIQSFTRNWTTKEWVYSFTQEWPFNPAPRHQLSYTLTGVSGGVPGAGGGFGDIALNYRYQMLGSGETRVAFAPRVSWLVPSGDSRQGRGAGGAGVQFSLPLSVKVLPKLVTHWNAGATLIPHAKNAAGDRAFAHGYNLAQSFIWLAHPRFNGMLETIFNRSQEVIGPRQTQWQTSVIMNPGFRWAYNFSNGLQIVPGISFPVEVARSGRGQAGFLLYLSFEHPFKKTRPGS